MPGVIPDDAAAAAQLHGSVVVAAAACLAAVAYLFVCVLWFSTQLRFRYLWRLRWRHLQAYAAAYNKASLPAGWWHKLSAPRCISYLHGCVTVLAATGRVAWYQAANAVVMQVMQGMSQGGQAAHSPFHAVCSFHPLLRSF